MYFKTMLINIPDNYPFFAANPEENKWVCPFFGRTGFRPDQLIWINTNDPIYVISHWKVVQTDENNNPVDKKNFRVFRFSRTENIAYVICDETEQLTILQEAQYLPEILRDMVQPLPNGVTLTVYRHIGLHDAAQEIYHK